MNCRWIGFFKFLIFSNKRFSVPHFFRRRHLDKPLAKNVAQKIFYKKLAQRKPTQTNANERDKRQEENGTIS